MYDNDEMLLNTMDDDLFFIENESEEEEQCIGNTSIQTQ